jgi:hypothetical protein
MRKSRIMQRLKDLFKEEREIDLRERTFPVNYDDYTVSWDAEFQRRVIKELIEDPRRERKLREEEFRFQDKLNRERLKRILEERTYNEGQ